MMHWRWKHPRTKAEILETRLGLFYPWRKRGVIQQSMRQFERTENMRRFRRWIVTGDRR